MPRTPRTPPAPRLGSRSYIDSILSNQISDRLRRIISPGHFPFYVLLQRAAVRFGEQQQLAHYGESRPEKVRPSYKAITALALGAASPQQIDELALLADEELPPSEVMLRRDGQAVRLQNALLPFVGEIDDLDTSSLADFCRVFVEIWQPSAKEFDSVAELLTTPDALTEQLFIQTCEELENGCDRPDLIRVKALYQGLAFAIRHLYQIGRKRDLPRSVALLVENLGIHAATYTNTSSPAKVRRAGSVFRVLWGLGHVPAGLHLAQNYFEYTNEPELHERAAQIVDAVWQICEAFPQELTASGSTVTLLKLRARSRSNVILHCQEESKVRQATIDLISSLLDAGMLDHAYKMELYRLLKGQSDDVSDADPESLDMIRWRINQFPSAKAEWQRAADLLINIPMSQMSGGGKRHV